VCSGNCWGEIKRTVLHTHGERPDAVAVSVRHRGHFLFFLLKRTTLSGCLSDGGAGGAGAGGAGADAGGVLLDCWMQYCTTY